MLSEPAILEDYLELVTYGFTNPMPDSDEGPWKITAKDVTGGEINYNTARRTTQEAYDTKLTKKSRPKIGDVLLTKDGTLGRLAIVQQEGLCINQSVAVLRPNEKILSEYLFYLLSTSEYQRQMISDSDGTVIKHIYITRVGKMEVEIPSIEEQKERLKHLLALDGKIKNNRQTNQTLEHMAQAIFKSWFVDFEPTRAKIVAKQNGQDPERAAIAAISGLSITPAEGALSELDQLSSEKIEQLKITAALFPDALVDSELGGIPEGWTVSPLTSVADVIMGHSPKGDTYNDKGDGTPLVNGPVEFGNYHTKKIKWTTAPTRMSKDRDLIVCVRGSTTGRLVKSDGDYCLGRGVCAIRSQGNQPYIDYLFKSEISKLLGMTTGSTFPSWNGPVLKGHEIVRPGSDVITAYTLMIENIELKISSSEVEIDQLAGLRDSLLPKLLSGELTI